MYLFRVRPYGNNTYIIMSSHLTLSQELSIIKGVNKFVYSIDISDWLDDDAYVLCAFTNVRDRIHTMRFSDQRAAVLASISFACIAEEVNVTVLDLSAEKMKFAYKMFAYKIGKSVESYAEIGKDLIDYLTQDIEDAESILKISNL